MKLFAKPRKRNARPSFLPSSKRLQPLRRGVPRVHLHQRQVPRQLKLRAEPSSPVLRATEKVKAVLTTLLKLVKHLP